MESKETRQCASSLEKANHLYKEGQYAEAVAVFSTVLVARPDCDAALSGRAGCLLHMGSDQLQLAVADIDRCLELNGNSSDGYCKKGLMLLQQNRIAEARAMFTTAIQLDENNQEAAAGYQRCLALLEEDVEHARVITHQQPGVRRCLQDPKIREALRLMQEDPMEARRVMKESVVVREGLHLLVQSGAIMFK